MPNALDVLCPGCFSQKGDATVCPNCGYDERWPPIPQTLRPRTVLRDRYIIGKVLGVPGGFGITYLSWDAQRKVRVALKEFMLRDLAVRGADGLQVAPADPKDQELFNHGLTRFLQEARTLAAFDHPSIVRVLHYFEDNGTGYIAMTYYEGRDLEDFTRKRGGRLDEDLVTDIMLKVLGGLVVVHQHRYLHRDIKPQNIYMAADKHPILLDFGAARQAIGTRGRLSVIVTPGFAPYEQYYSQGHQGPWTDVYACAATAYYLVTGKLPASAFDRLDDDALRPLQELRPELSPGFCEAIHHAMAVRPEHRLQSAHALRDLLYHASQAPRGQAQTKVVRCPHCSAPNRLPHIGARQAQCGRCQRSLFNTAEAEQGTRVLRCPYCNAKNRIAVGPRGTIDPQSRCGRCQRPLVT